MIRVKVRDDLVSEGCDVRRDLLELVRIRRCVGTLHAEDVRSASDLVEQPT